MIFRDPIWLKSQRRYHKLSIENLNALTRSYNLLAPELAKKPYFSVERELRKCYRHVAPLLPSEIKERAKLGKASALGGSVVDGSTGSGTGGEEGAEPTVYEDLGLKFGFKQLWSSMFQKKKGSR